MGKFDGILLCTDMDGTLLDEKSEISRENLEAIDFFRSEGGLFTVISGRIASSIFPFAEILKLDIPFGCQNGGVLYDYPNRKTVFVNELKADVNAILRFAFDAFPYAGIEAVISDTFYCIRDNEFTELHRSYEHHERIFKDITDIKGNVIKLVFAMPENKTDEFIGAVKERFGENAFTIFRSFPNFVEILENGTSKGSMLLEMKKFLGKIDSLQPKLTVAAGDNDNDEQMIKNADIGYAVENASETVKKAADLITVSNDNHAIAAIIRDLSLKF